MMHHGTAELQPCRNLHLYIFRTCECRLSTTPSPNLDSIQLLLTFLYQGVGYVEKSHRSSKRKPDLWNRMRKYLVPQASVYPHKAKTFAVDKQTAMEKMTHQDFKVHVSWFFVLYYRKLNWRRSDGRPPPKWTVSPLVEVYAGGLCSAVGVQLIMIIMSFRFF